jgi:hypothetical protein
MPTAAQNTKLSLTMQPPAAALQIPIATPKAHRVPVKPVARTQPQEKETLAAPAPIPEPGTLHLKLPQDVRAFVDGKRYGRSELNSIRLTEGEHKVLLERDGFQPIEKTIRIRSAAITKIEIGETPPGEHTQ